MLKCREITGILASDALEEASRTRRLSVQLHLMMCRHCRRYAAQLRALASLARRVLGPRGAPEDPETLERLERAILARKSGE